MATMSVGEMQTKISYAAREAVSVKIQNARILSTHLGPEDHGIPTAMLTLEGQHDSTGFGGYDLRHHGIGYVTQLLSALCVSTWEKLPSQVVRMAIAGHMCIAVGHVMQDRWFVCDKDGPRVVTEADLLSVAVARVGG